jgi:hypothetical protein
MVYMHISVCMDVSMYYVECMPAYIPTNVDTQLRFLGSAAVKKIHVLYVGQT